MTAFDRAWVLLKAPFDIHVGCDSQPPEYQHEGPLYRGRDEGDRQTNDYWAGDPEMALAYAVFGSAVPSTERGQKRIPIPMRITKPMLDVVEDDQTGDRPLLEDPESGRGMFNDNYWSINEDEDVQQMPKEKIAEMIQGWMEGGFGDDDYIYATSARLHPDEKVKRHLQGALARLNLPEGQQLIDRWAPAEPVQGRTGEGGPYAYGV